MTTSYRMEHDSMGELKVRAEALWGAQTQRAIDNFPISGQPLPRAFVGALGLIKQAAARANRRLGLLPPDIAAAVEAAAAEVAAGRHDAAFPLDVFQTGSGTSSNMNANEVIATLASRHLGRAVHPNDHVNVAQSSNDCIPTAIHVSAALLVRRELVPALTQLRDALHSREKELAAVVKTGRTHLMDAMPVTLGQELSGWRTQVEQGLARLAAVEPRLLRLAQGGTAVGTGINAPAGYGGQFCEELRAITGVPFAPADNYFEAMSAQDTAVELSGQLKVIAEATTMVAAQVIGNDTTITIAGQSGNFQLNVMLPLIAYNLLESIRLLGNVTRLLPQRAVKGFTVNTARIAEGLDRNPILVTALNPVIGYEKGAAIAKQAYAQGRPIRAVAEEMTRLPAAELARLLDPAELTRGGIKGGAGGGG